MKGVLEFNLPEEQEEFDRACKATNYSIAIEEIRNDIFRPARKHGYPDAKIAAFMRGNPDSHVLVGYLEELFVQILRDNNLLSD